MGIINIGIINIAFTFTLLYIVTRTVKFSEQGSCDSIAPTPQPLLHRNGKRLYKTNPQSPCLHYIANPSPPHLPKTVRTTGTRLPTATCVSRSMQPMKSPDYISGKTPAGSSLAGKKETAAPHRLSRPSLPTLPVLRAIVSLFSQRFQQNRLEQVC